MKYPEKDWLEVAKKLPQGGQQRMLCSEGCGGDNSQLVSHNDKGYSRYCFRCKETKFEPAGLRTIEQIERTRKERALVLNGMGGDKVTLPSDFTSDIPAKAAIWFYKYGISAELARAYNIGYTPSLNRVVLPVYEDGELVTLQMRAIDEWTKPKYLNPSVKNMSRLLFDSRINGYGKPERVTVIVEDILSAIKIGKVHHATSILGTNMTAIRAAKIAALNHTALVWLDGDKAGVDGAIQAKKQLELQNVRVININTEHDPKTYSLDEIRRLTSYD